MLCKIAGRSQDVKPIVWPSAGGPSRYSGSAEVNAGEVAELRQRLAELERSRQAELAQVQQAAFQQGLRQAREEAAAEVSASSDRLAKTLAELASLKRKVRNEAEIELVNLSLAIARRILYRELATDPEAIHGLVHAALQRLQNREIWRVRVYPAGSGAVRAALEQIGAAAAIEIVSDPSLGTGDLLFETPAGELDASVETHLQEIERGFADRLRLR